MRVPPFLLVEEATVLKLSVFLSESIFASDEFLRFYRHWSLWSLFRVDFLMLDWAMAACLF